MTFNYQGKDYDLKYSIRAIMIYENATNKSFNPKTFSDIITFFYCILVSSGKGDVFDFEVFTSILDEHPEKIQEFSEWLTGVFTMNQVMAPQQEIKEETKVEAEKESEKN